jgi:hypothetical protein
VAEREKARNPEVSTYGRYHTNIWGRDTTDELAGKRPDRVPLLASVGFGLESRAKSHPCDDA